MPPFALWLLTLVTMLAFAANSLLCRMALADASIDPASFTAWRLGSGAITLWLLHTLARKKTPASTMSGSWPAATALFIYAAGFSLAYVQLNTATGALILFAAVQLCMTGFGLWRGERFNRWQWLGLATALAGLVYLLAPAAERPDLLSAAIMAVAGAAWAVYSLLGKAVQQPLAFTAGNFIRATLFAAPLLAYYLDQLTMNTGGVILALTSGALASGVGYALWYRVLPQLQSLTAASVQLSVPVLAALMGVVLLAEPLSLTLIIASVAVVTGVFLVLRARR